MSLTQWFTRSCPTVSCRPVAKATLSLVPTPSAELTSTGFFQPASWKPAPNEPMSVRTPRVKVFRARRLMCDTARSGLVDVNAGVLVPDRFWVYHR